MNQRVVELETILADKENMRGPAGPAGPQGETGPQGSRFCTLAELHINTSFNQTKNL